ncbi:MAG: GGDEF domain-containing protein [Lachnospiraceae bacterium]|nr:GGDEF domain-containing protein [Lachnospiraceae bacterium]
MEFYSAVVYIQVLSAIVMAVVVWTNPILENGLKKAFSIEFGIIATASVCSYFADSLNNSAEKFRALHYIAKIAEFTLIPVLLLVAIVSLKVVKKTIVFYTLVALNFLAQLLTAKYHFIFYMDENNVYTRGEFYCTYVVFYVLLTLLFINYIIMKGMQFQSFSKTVVLAITGFLALTLPIQIIFTNIRTAFLVIEFAVIMAYIYINNLIIQLDKLTGMLNRWQYEKMLKKANYPTCVFIFDVDSFKTINDTFGHQIGDRALQLAASEIKKHFAKEGYCFRIGGDEFCVILKKKSRYAKAQSDEMLWALIDRFETDIKEIHRNEPTFTGVSVGYAFTDGPFDINWAIEKADMMMYKKKRHAKE